MAKSKSTGTFLVPDGAGGMTKVEDRRFEAGEWPIQFVIPEGQADTWRQHFVAECNRRNWTPSEIEQLEAKQNSGSISVNIAVGGQQQLAVVWERKRDGPLCVRARSSGPVEFPPNEIEELFQRVNEASRTNIREGFFFRRGLRYEGLPWRGELWLDRHAVCHGAPEEHLTPGCSRHDVFAHAPATTACATVRRHSP